uniref:Ribosomal protein L16 Arg81 hydroxylase, contains JmjC domain n=1 Tax=Candidatus Kentrum sp. UNK TaxID=2126344 RepID=A0A451ALD0_9GAMM|nr:MAG: Ribosomal protein L16 Arg81 hydroxylase, contains JmjC domain [Candidatus Kentron sp. UNK]VFK72244.1 MAG: Ribosomal protein L16 Arg81 hydroxylase, contains JmjC domain [Candidatus Kentron sp. UNK]
MTLFAATLPTEPTGHCNPYLGRNPCEMVESTRSIGPEDFRGDFVERYRPLLIEGGVAHWDAMRLWNNDYLRERVGFHTVSVETSRDQFEGRIFTDAEKVEMPFSRFLDRLSLPAGETDYFVAAFQFPELLADMPDIAVSSVFGMQHRQRMLMTRGGNYIAFHYDWYQNLLCQVAGSKTLILADITNTPNMYRLLETQMPNYSPINLREPNTDRYPDFARAPLIRVDLEAGDVLYLPPLWWHTVESRDRNIAISISFFETNAELLYMLRKMSDHRAFGLPANEEAHIRSILDGHDGDRDKLRAIRRYASDKRLSPVLMFFGQRNLRYWTT